MRPLRFFISLLLYAAIPFGLRGWGGEIAPSKIVLIQQAIASMHLKAQLEGFIQATAAVKAKRIATENPALSDSLAAEIKAVIDSVYGENTEAGKNLTAQLYQVFDKYLSEDDLKFAAHYQGSDAGQRFAKMAPRIMQEGMEAEKKWDESLQPLIRDRIRDRFGSWNLKLP